MRPLIWIGRFGGHTGFSTSTREYFKAVRPFVPECYAASLENLTPDDPLYSAIIPPALLDQIEERAVKVVNHQPTTDPEAQVYFSVCEYDSIPPIWTEILSQAKAILTQSQFCIDVFTRCIRDQYPGKIIPPMYIIPYILPPEFKPDGPIDRRFPADQCVFGSVFEWIPRKAPDRLLTAFMREFAPTEPVRLMIRTYTHKIPNLAAYVRQHWPDPRIVVIESPIQDLPAFYRGLDGYLSPTAGESWGQTLTEAMVCGVPTVGSNHSGNLEFMNHENSYLVDVEEWSPVENNPSACWRLPVIESIQRAMREIFTHWSNRTRNPKIDPALRLLRELTPERIGPKIFQALKQVLEEE
jgi:glycosyltransferase involved in cell wall biosynthesis